MKLNPKNLPLMSLLISSILPLPSSATTSINLPEVKVGEYWQKHTGNVLPLLAVKNTAQDTWFYPQSVSSQLPANYSAKAYFTNSSCNNSLCVAVGANFDYKQNLWTPLLAQSQDQGKTWSYVTNIQTDSQMNKELDEVSCNNEICVATGVIYNDETGPFPTLLVSDHGQWYTPALESSDINNKKLSHIACQDTYCVAVGYGTDQQDTQGFPIVATSHDKEKKQWVFSQPLKTDSYNTYAQSLSCNDKLCMIAGATGDGRSGEPILATSTDHGITWVYSDDININLPADFAYNGVLNNAKCFNNLCIAVGRYNRVYTQNLDSPLIAISLDAGKSWKYTSQTIANLPDGYKEARLQDVSCNDKICIAIGEYQVAKPADPMNNRSPFLIVSKDQGTTWSYVNALPNKSTTYGFFTQVNCQTNACSIAGAYGNPLQPLSIKTEDAGVTWSSSESLISSLPQDFSAGGFYNSSSILMKNTTKQHLNHLR